MLQEEAQDSGTGTRNQNYRLLVQTVAAAEQLVELDAARNVENERQQ